MIGALIAKRTTRAAYEALNQHDLETFLKGWHEDATFIYPGDIKVSGKHEGKTAIREWFQTFMNQFPKFEFKVKRVAVTNIFDVVGSIVVITEWDAKITNKDGFSSENSGTTVTESKNGKAIHVKDYLFNANEVWRKVWGVEQ